MQRDWPWRSCILLMIVTILMFLVSYITKYFGRKEYLGTPSTSSKVNYQSSDTQPKEQPSSSQSVVLIESPEVMDSRLFARPSSSSVNTHSVVPPADPLQAPVSSVSNDESKKHVPQKPSDSSNQLAKLNDQKLDAILSTVKTLQESIRELKNEFSALKPRVGSFQTSSTCPGMIVRTAASTNTQGDLQKWMAKRRKAPMQ